jgi:Rrf2 family iron-sulfur cluster assembly transcriptional regulator
MLPGVLAKSDTCIQYWPVGGTAMFSRSAGYSIQALTYLAGQPPGKLTGAREIAAAAGIPMPYLWKILRNLSQQKLLRSFKGVRGGYELARPAHKISVSEILAATPDIGLVATCVLGLGRCDDHNPCALHTSWQDLRAKIENLMDRKTLADLARERPKSVRKRSRSGVRNRPTRP